MQPLQPLAILHVGLAPRHAAQVAGVDQQHLQAIRLEELIDRHPVDMRALHRHRLDPVLQQPLRQGVQVPGRGREGAHAQHPPGARRRTDPMLPAAEIDPGDDRTSCCRLRANQLRVLLTAAAYVLMQELRLHAARTACARTQVMWLRDRLLKLSVHVSAPSAASSCTCRARRRISTRGARSPFPSGRAPGNASNPRLNPLARPPSRRSCPWPALQDGHRASYCCSTTPSPVDGVIQTLVPPDSRADHTLPVVGQDPS